METGIFLIHMEIQEHCICQLNFIWFSFTWPNMFICYSTWFTIIKEYWEL